MTAADAHSLATLRYRSFVLTRRDPHYLPLLVSLLLIALALASMRPPVLHKAAGMAPPSVGAALLPARWVCDPPQSINGELLRCRPADVGKRQKRI